MRGPRPWHALSLVVLATRAKPLDASGPTKRAVENVWDYPRPAVLVPCEDELVALSDSSSDSTQLARVKCQAARL